MKQKRLAAAGKILRRCTICGKFHASYLVDDPTLGKCYLCYSCWTARQAQQVEEGVGERLNDEKHAHERKQ